MPFKRQDGVCTMFHVACTWYLVLISDGTLMWQMGVER